MIHNQFCDVVHETPGHALEAAGNRINIVYDAEFDPGGQSSRPRGYLLAGSHLMTSVLDPS